MRRSRGPIRPVQAGSVCVIATAALVAFQLAAAARTEHGSSRATTAAAGGTVFGGTSAQDFPVVIATSKNGRKVVRASIAIRVACTSGARVTVPDAYANMPVNKQRKFSASFGPATQRNDDGTTTDFEGTISGAINKARTKASGTWTFKATDHDASGAVTDTCDSGKVNWTAKQ